jgi:hypothetical protein
MGWRAINKQGELLLEEKHGRPMEQGEQGNLLLIAQEDYLQSVAVDLVNGNILFGYEELSVDEETKKINIKNPKYVLSICDETNRVHDLFWTDTTEPDAEGNVINTYRPIEWRPIWFTRNTFSPIGMIAVKVIGAQATLPREFGGKNVKKLISLFPDGGIGID